MPGTPRSPHWQPARHCLFDASSFSAETFSSGHTAADSCDGGEAYFETFESLKAASVSLSLHESPSCSNLLPCGLLPDELAELESVAAAAASPALQVEAAVTALSSMALGGGDFLDESVAPLTPTTSHERPLMVVGLVSDPDTAAAPGALGVSGAGTGALRDLVGAAAEVAPARVEPATEPASPIPAAS